MATWKEERYTAANREAEIGLVFLAFMDEGELSAKLDAVEMRDFAYDDTRFLFDECARMRKAGQPVSDAAAQVSWFKRPEVLKRMGESSLRDWLESKVVPSAKILETLFDGDFAKAHRADWYIQEVRRWRIKRGLRALSLDLDQVSYDLEPAEAIQWLDERIVELKQVAAPLLA